MMLLRRCQARIFKNRAEHHSSNLTIAYLIKQLLNFSFFLHAGCLSFHNGMTLIVCEFNHRYINITRFQQPSYLIFF